MFTRKREHCGPEFEDVVIPMLARFNSRQVPKNSTALRDALLKVASYTCVSQPHFAACEMKRGMLSAHPEGGTCTSLWNSYPKFSTCAGDD